MMGKQHCRESRSWRCPRCCFDNFRISRIAPQRSRGSKTDEGGRLITRRLYLDIYSTRMMAARVLCPFSVGRWRRREGGGRREGVDDWMCVMQYETRAKQQNSKTAKQQSAKFPEIEKRRGDLGARAKKNGRRGIRTTGCVGGNTGRKRCAMSWINVPRRMEP